MLKEYIGNIQNLKDEECSKLFLGIACVCAVY